MTKQSASHPFVRQDMLINPFMANLDRLIFMQPSRNLLGAPIQTQLGFDRLPCFLKNTNMSVFVTIERFEIGLSGSISSPATITPHLSAYGGFMAANHSSYLRLVVSYFQQSINLV